jgi:hypothetical protein
MRYVSFVSHGLCFHGYPQENYETVEVICTSLPFNNSNYWAVNVILNTVKMAEQSGIPLAITVSVRCILSVCILVRVCIQRSFSYIGSPHIGVGTGLLGGGGVLL